jgi:hypothetical protein
MRNRTYRSMTIPAVLLLVTAGGCANPVTTRDGANLLAAYTTSVKQRIQANAASRDQLADARRELVEWLNAAAVDTEQANQRESTVFRIADDKTRYKLYESIIAASQVGVRAAPTAAPATSPASSLAVTAVKARLDQLGAAAKTLTQLGTSTGLQEELKFISGWIGAVGTSLDEARREREAHTAQGMASVEAKRNEIASDISKGNEAANTQLNK